jgi:endonuclease V-like protein UPF0215 family
MGSSHEMDYGININKFNFVYRTANSRFKGKCARQAAEAVMEVYGQFIEEGNLAAVASSKVTKSPSVYKVLVVLMDGIGEPFKQVLDITLDAKTCKNPIIKYSR